MSAADGKHRLTPVQLIALFLWRGGLMLVVSYSFFRAARFVLTYVDLPLRLEIGLGLTLAGAAMVLLSLILERVQDARAERGTMG